VGPTGLTLKEPGEGYAIFEVRSPWVIVPVVGDFDSRGDDREASVVKLNAANTALFLSLDHGTTWQNLQTAGGTLDLTRHVSGTYGYLLKFTLRGQRTQAVLRSLEITTWVQVHPASLPALRKGTNTMQLVAGDHYDLQTRVLEIRPSMARPDEFLKSWLSHPRTMIPPGARVACAERSSSKWWHRQTQDCWFSAEASFETHQGAAARTRATPLPTPRMNPGRFADLPRGCAHRPKPLALQRGSRVRLDSPAAGYSFATWATLR
jgi:hypothetical protein